MSIGNDEAVVKVLYKQCTKFFHSRINASKLTLYFFDNTLLLDSTFHNFDNIGITRVDDRLKSRK